MSWYQHKANAIKTTVPTLAIHYPVKAHMSGVPHIPLIFLKNQVSELLKAKHSVCFV